MSIRRATAFLLAVSLLGAGHLGAVQRVDRLELDAVFARWDRSDSPGCAVGVDIDGARLARAGYGLANVEQGRPWTSETPGYLGSVSKQFTAFMVTLLDERGRWSLDDDIREHVPELPDFATPVTLSNLLRHTGGIPDFPGLMYYAGFGRQRPYGDPEILAVLKRTHRLLFPPGTDASYSTSGYWLLTRAVENLVGRPWADVLGEEVFEPLGMRQSYLQTDLSQLVPGRSVGYEALGSDGFRLYERSFVTTASMFTSVDDLLRWADNFRETRVGGRAVLEHMHQPTVLAGGDTIPEAAGLLLEQLRGHAMISHDGRNAGHSAQLLRFPESRMAIAVLCNVRQASADRLAVAVAETVLPRVELDHARLDATDTTPVESPADDGSTTPSVAWNPPLDQLPRLMGLYVRGENAFMLSLRDDEPPSEDAIEVRFNHGDELLGVTRLESGRFRLVGAGASPSETLEFVPADGTDQPSIRYGDGRGQLRFERVAMAADRELSGIVGEYFSSELDVTYSVRLEDLRLVVRIESPHASDILPRGLYYLGGLSWTDGAGTRIDFVGAAGSNLLSLSDPRVGTIEFVSEPAGP
ncbi:MAG: beta-lactamase family protein [Gemmatimonadetes bacterium]|nr:beta-lactamase family protein [Gemmatimonadota bacterium]